MTAYTFTVDLVRAVSDWQRGGDEQQKKKRGLALKLAAKGIPDTFKSAKKCYRQIALDKSAVWKVGTTLQLSETISSWTESIEIAKTFKGGVPPIGYQGVIFTVQPTIDQVIVNLKILYSDRDFISCLDANKSEISGYDQGAGLYAGSQDEVILEIENLPLNSVHAWGGYTGAVHQLAEMFYRHEPSDEELANFRILLSQAGHECGPYWLSTPEAVSRIIERLKYFGELLK